MTDTVSQQKFDDYLQLSQEALTIAQAAEITDENAAAEIFSMVGNYLSDAQYFADNGDLVRGFAAINYAHGWLDCGARLKIYLVDNNHFFTEDGQD